MSFEETLRGYQLTTAVILYQMPDHPSLVQEFILQQLDLAPKYPRLSKFLDFWKINIEGKLVHVRVAVSDLINPRDFQFGTEYGLN